jgi:hypothetical protein
MEHTKWRLPEWLYRPCMAIGPARERLRARLAALRRGDPERVARVGPGLGCAESLREQRRRIFYCGFWEKWMGSGARKRCD